MQLLARPTYLLAALSLVVVTTPGLCQETPDRGEAVDLRSPTFTLEGAAVPYAVRAEALFSGLAQLRANDINKGNESVASFMRTLGFDPESSAALELIDLSVALENEHPKVSREIQEQAQIGIGVDLDQPGGWMDQRYAKVGGALGNWLLNRQEEGWAIEPLLDRLLNGSHIGVSVFSDDSETTLMKRVNRQCKAMNEALAKEFGDVPRRFEQQQGRSQR